MAERKLNDVRNYLNQATANESLIPEIRLARQVLDLQLLKYAVMDKESYEPEIEKCIDTCITGFIWLYANGGTHSTLPDCINKDAEAKEYYAHFSASWDKLQDYMRTNMDLMDM